MKLMRLLAWLFVIGLLPGELLAQQQVTVSGRITDSKTNLPLVGATVRVKNDKASTVSDAEGRFTIVAPSSESVITITYVGYQVFETKVGNGILNVEMVSLDNDLNEVVVVGYGTQKKAHLTGAVETIKAKEVEDLPVGNLGAALTGRVLGLNVSGGVARPGVQAELTVRNPMSLAKDGGNNYPLYVIDGVVQVDSRGNVDPTLFNSLDASEIESITVLKDGAAAIYGSRAANGAIIVTTKRGSSGKTRISYSGSYAVNDAVKHTEMMSAYELARYINIVNGPNGANANASDVNYFFSDDELEHYKTIDHNWLEAAWKSAYNMRHTFNLSGGNDKNSYFANVSYYTQDGNIGRLDYKKWTYRAGLDATVAAGLKASLQVSGIYNTEFAFNNKIGGEQIENDYRNLLKTPRYMPMYIDGRPVKLNGPTGNNIANYHFFELNRLNNYKDKEGHTLSLNAALEYEVPFIKGLRLRGSFARNSGSSHESRIGSRYWLWRFNGTGQNGHIYDNAPVRDSAQYDNDNAVRFFNHHNVLVQSNFSVMYNRSFGEHEISAYFGVERSETHSSQEDQTKENPSAFTNGQFNTAFGAIDARTFAYEAGSLGYVGRLNYNYAGKYLAEFLFRSDASTKFAPENYWGKFYSLSAGWVMSDENFFDVKWIDFLKLRYSVGLLGKDDMGAWMWRQRFTFQNGKGAVFGGDNTNAGIGMKMEASPNPDATWSDDFKQNLGIDARFLNNRLSATIELFYNKATGMLLERTAIVPVTVGGTIASQNYGAADFFGYELGLGWRGKVGRDFTYGIDGRFSWYDNKVRKGNFNEFDMLKPWNKRPGESDDNGVWGYDVMGMFTSQEQINEYVSKYGITSVFGQPVANLRPGMLYYRDVRGQLQPDGTFAGPDGIIDENDQVQLSKKKNNHYSFGFTLKASYKGFAFDAVIGGSFGGWSELDARDATLERNISNLYLNGPAYWADIYDPVLNPTGKYPNPFHRAISLQPTSNFWKVSSFRMRLINVNLSYAVPKKVTEFLRISNARVVVTMLNPLNLYNPFGYKDPYNSWEDYPVLRTISTGLNITF